MRLMPIGLNEKDAGPITVPRRSSPRRTADDSIDLDQGIESAAGRSFSWRAIHAVSLCHVASLLWLRLEPREASGLPLGSLFVHTNSYGQATENCTQKEDRPVAWRYRTIRSRQPDTQPNITSLAAFWIRQALMQARVASLHMTPLI